VQDGSPTNEVPSPADPLGSIFLRFLKFGALAWGGPAAQIAMIKRECVDEERWVSEETFKKLLAVYQGGCAGGSWEDSSQAWGSCCRASS